MSVVVVQGSPFDQGVKQGQALGDSILSNIALVKTKMEQERVDLDRYHAFIKRNARFLENAHPELFQEMKGIAEGAKLPFEDILLLNIPGYFMTRYFNQECSMVLARKNATLDGKTYVLKNRDMGIHIEQAVIHRVFEDGRKLIEVNGAGTVTYPASGINSDGVAITTTGFWSKAVEPDLEEVDTAHIFVNIRILLERCKTADEVVEMLKTYPRMNGLNIIVSDSENAYAIETTRKGMLIQADEGTGTLHRSNHYVLEEHVALNPEVSQYTSTFKRYERIGEMLEAKRGQLRFQDLYRIMSDHENGINAICRHPQGDIQSKTVSCTVIVVEDFELWTSIGNPCESLNFSSINE